MATLAPPPFMKTSTTAACQMWRNVVSASHIMNTCPDFPIITDNCSLVQDSSCTSELFIIFLPCFSWSLFSFCVYIYHELESFCCYKSFDRCYMWLIMFYYHDHDTPHCQDHCPSCVVFIVIIESANDYLVYCLIHYRTFVEGIICFYSVKNMPPKLKKIISWISTTHNGLTILELN